MQNEQKKTISIRPLCPADVPEIIEHLKTLEPDMLRCRFCRYVSEEQIEDHCSAISWHKSILYGAFVGTSIIGITELYSEDSGGRVNAELGITLNRAYRGRGIAARMLKQALRAARNRRITEISVHYDPANHNLRKLIRNTGYSTQNDPIEGWARITLDDPDRDSLEAQRLEDAEGYAHWLVARLGQQTEMAARDS